MTRLAQFIAVAALYALCALSGAAALSGVLPSTATSEPGLVAQPWAFLILVSVNAALIIALLQSSRWRGLRLACLYAPVYYLAVTFLMQIETWYFLGETHIGADVLRGLFVMGLPVAFVTLPAAVWIVGRGEGDTITAVLAGGIYSPGQMAGRCLLAALSYLALYFLAGYFIAWQNPELRAFYGQPGPALPFLSHLATLWREDAAVFGFQILRSQLWVLCAMPVILSTRLKLPGTALMVGLFLSVPQNIVHIMENPLMPDASIRLAHLVETVSSMLLFGAILAVLFYPRRQGAVQS